MKNQNVVVKKNTFDYLAPGGRGWHEVPGEGDTQADTSNISPSSALRASSPSRGEVNRGFTLIELLVVVLIIGILAAVALPQYKLAVVKARTNNILPIIKSIANAEEAHFLENGTYTSDVQQLTVDIPAECVPPTKNDYNNLWTCGDFLIDVMTDGIATKYCPGYSNDYGTCSDNRDFMLRLHYTHAENNSGKHFCYPYNSSALGTKICNSLIL